RSRPCHISSSGGRCSWPPRSVRSPPLVVDDDVGRCRHTLCHRQQLTRIADPVRAPGGQLAARFLEIFKKGRKLAAHPPRWRSPAGAQDRPRGPSPAWNPRTDPPYHWGRRPWPLSFISVPPSHSPAASPLLPGSISLS